MRQFLFCLIRCYDRSYAQTYAKKGIPFVGIEGNSPTSGTYGDMDANGVITSSDALAVLRASVGTSF